MASSNGWRLGRMITKRVAEKADQREYESYASGTGATASSRPSESQTPARCANQYCGGWLSVASKRLGRCEGCGTGIELSP